MINQLSFETPVGFLNITTDSESIYRAVFSKTPVEMHYEHTALSLHIRQEILAYFSDPTHQFNLPLNYQGTPHQLKVWSHLLTIQSGDTLTYGDMARELNSSPRAIGQACRSNPITLFIPCHRVVGKNSLGGYMGQQGTDYKVALLKHEFFSAPFRAPPRHFSLCSKRRVQHESDYSPLK